MQVLCHARRSVTSFVMQASENLHSIVHSNIKYNVELSMSVSQPSYEEQQAVFGTSSHNIRTTLRKSKTVNHNS